MDQARDSSRYLHRLSEIEQALEGKYKILQRLGSGGFGEVYLGEHVALGRKVAIKILLDVYASQPDSVERFHREARAAATLQHPNIIDTYDVGEANGLQYFVMKYIDGETLGAKLDRDKRIRADESVHIVKQLADALDYAHQNDVIHRDIKPGNIMLDSFGKPILMDFGVARVQYEGHLTKTGTLMGTPHYLAPEQPLGKEVDGRSDIYSLGIMFYEMLVGRPPFHDENAVTLIFKHINEQPYPIKQHLPELDQRLCEIVHKMIAKEPDDRYQIAGKVVDELETLKLIYPAPTTLAARRSTPAKTRNTERLMLLAQEHLRHHKLDLAVEIYETISRRDPENESVKKSLNDLSVKLKMMKEDKTQERMSLEEEVFAVNLQRAELLLDDQEFQQARAEVQKILMRKPEHKIALAKLEEIEALEISAQAPADNVPEEPVVPPAGQPDPYADAEQYDAVDYSTVTAEPDSYQQPEFVEHPEMSEPAERPEPPPLPPLPMPAQPKRSGAGLWIALVFVFVLLLGAGGFFLWQKMHPATPQTPVAVAQPKVEAPPIVKQEPAPTPPPPAPTTGALHITTEPAGATVTVGDENKGVSPLDIPDLPFGKYTVKVQLKGYADQQQEIELNGENADLQVPFALSTVAPVAGIVLIGSEPSGAEIIIKNRMVGLTPKKFPSMAAGKHEVWLKKKGFQDYIETIRVTAGETTTLQAELKPVEPEVKPPPPKPVEPEVVPGMLVELGPDVVPPKAIKKTAPKFDRKNKKMAGTCKLKVLVSEQGKILEVRVAQSANKVLDQISIDTVREWQYQPATKKGVPVKVWVDVSFSYNP